MHEFWYYCRDDAAQRNVGEGWMAEMCVGVHDIGVAPPMVLDLEHSSCGEILDDAADLTFRDTQGSR
ncbi:MAG: hypothetical protein M3220_00040 [Chloroflexota bacterium]|nr:hypothetical protein [Chloroflexota bacterium]